MQIVISTVLILFISLLMGCSDEATQPEPAIRGLKTVLIGSTSNTTKRRYPTVLQSANVVSLSFELSGRLGKNRLEVGQLVKAGDVLVELDPKSLQLAVDEARAALQQAQANAANAASEFTRQEKLLAKGIVSAAKVERAKNDEKTSKAQVAQARKRFESAEETLSKSRLVAPFDGVISAVAVDSFETVTPGQSIASMYNPEKFEARFSVSYDVANRLAVGDPVSVRVADSPDVSLDGLVSELGSSAGAVSSFPVVIRLLENSPTLKSGIAIEVTLEVAVSEEKGHAIPLSALIVEGELEPEKDSGEVFMEVFVYEEGTGTVVRRQVEVVGLKDNQVIVSGGVLEGDRVAIAGVSFLREGMRVKLLTNDKGH